MTSPLPNIVIFVADQMNAAALPAYGNHVVHAPNITRLADAGVTFDAAYCSTPLCAPSRYGLLTGSLPSRFGCFDNASELPSEVPTFAHHLRQLGYLTILAGKMHFVGPNQLHGFEERLTTDIYPADFGWTPDWDQAGERQSWFHNRSSVTQAGNCVRTNQLDYDEEVIFRSRRRLFDLARGSDKRPFLLVVSLTHPHDPYAINDQYWDLYRDADIDMPRLRAGDVPEDPHSQRLRHACDLDHAEISEASIRAARRAYYGAISFVDEQLGTLGETLSQTGYASNTLTILTSDHGDMLGERGMWYKMSFFEGSARVPLIISAPERFRPHRVSNAVSLLDLLPTLIDLAGGNSTRDLPVPGDGRSLLPHLKGEAGHNMALAEYSAEGALTPIVMIRTGPFKFIYSPADPPQLFDLHKDPDELDNLAASAEFAPVVSRFCTEISRRWDIPAVHASVLASQRRRRLISVSQSIGKLTAWDYQPTEDASQQYVRSHLELDTLEAMARFPAAGGA